MEMPFLPKSKSWRIMTIVLASLVLLVAFFYAEEDLRGWLAWEHCERDLAAKGETLDWNDYIPAPVPDDQNFFKAPKMTDWFVRGHNGTEFQNPLANSNTVSVIATETAANNYLAWSDKLQPQFDLIREALKRPYARMDGDYSKPFEQPIPNFISMRALAQVLEQSAKCHLFLNQPDKALNELTLLNDSRRLLEAAPTGKPMTLVAAMINVAVTGLYADTIAGGLQSHAWQEPQLAALQQQLADINLTPFVLQSFQDEPADVCRDIEIAPRPKFFGLFNMTDHAKWTDKVGWWLWPRGWTYQNMVNVAMLEVKPLEAFDLAHDTVAPRKFEEANRTVEKFVRHGRSPYKILAATVIPNFSKAEQVAAHNQTMVNEAQIACALERYHLARGEYPETLDALAPQFISQIPHDIIGGEPLVYRPIADGKFLLYSVGWNEKDDGGLEVQTKTGGIDYTDGDWVWKN